MKDPSSSRTVYASPLNEIGSEWSITQALFNLFQTEPTAGTRIHDSFCPKGMRQGQVVWVGQDVQFAGEKTMRIGTPVTFTRYLYDRTLSAHTSFGCPVFKYAFFRFPDGTERSLMADSFTTYNPNSVLGRAYRLAKWLGMCH